MRALVHHTIVTLSTAAGLLLRCIYSIYQLRFLEPAGPNVICTFGVEQLAKHRRKGAAGNVAIQKRDQRGEQITHMEVTDEGRRGCTAEC